MNKYVLCFFCSSSISSTKSGTNDVIISKVFRWLLSISSATTYGGCRCGCALPTEFNKFYRSHHIFLHGNNTVFYACIKSHTENVHLAFFSLMPNFSHHILVHESCYYHLKN